MLTSSEDVSVCSLMALSNKKDDELINDAETCYDILKNHFFSANAIQSLSHVLAISDGSSEIKCERTIELFELLKSKGYKYGTSYELPTLGLLATTNVDLQRLVDEIIEVDDWLKKQNGFGFFGGVSRKQRLMYAGILVNKGYTIGDIMQNTAVTGIISSIIAQQVVMCATISASVAANSAATN